MVDPQPSKGYPVKILCILGSPSPAAWSRRLATAVADRLRVHDCEVDLLDLRDLPLAMLDTEAYGRGGVYPHEGARELRARVAAADGVVLATSVFHSSYSGLLKSALDHLEADAFENKPVALLANAGSERGATIACEHLRSVVKALSGWAVPMQVASSQADFDQETGQIKPGNVVRRCEIMCDELVKFIEAFSSLRVPR
ncbi:NADPH-dependent FMN reductase [Streptomyces tremellae]